MLAAAAAVVLVALALSACGSDDSSSSSAPDTSGGGSLHQQDGDRRPREADRLRLEPAGRRGRQRAADSAGAELEVADGIGYENVEPNLRRLAQSGAS